MRQYVEPADDHGNQGQNEEHDQDRSVDDLCGFGRCRTRMISHESEDKAKKGNGSDNRDSVAPQPCREFFNDGGGQQCMCYFGALRS
ncbi:hypothetical protein D9M69_690310 [compost metagenome]